ncbi:hypothetical protein IAE35_02705 [Pseudomonas sp. S75]|uniref:hypothetical protein n=1 Tax=unclassified Pseudomonas TaxID=196821 RepID=UPI0019047AE5|nr:MULTISPECIES: hypothetical protein [unclassified Pseudomonas]MBJ9973832.1 hypothetical protein [Pseudomonas sp. S30]MBK0152238.1 hypothetical protein [Pseudomonas sp. S75]
MNNAIRLSMSITAALVIAVLAGCASPPQTHAPSVEDSRQLQLEALQRRGLSLQDYERQRAAILRAGQAVEVATDAVHPDDATSG